MLDRGSVEEEDVVVLALASSLGPPRVAEQVANIGDPGEVGQQAHAHGRRRFKDEGAEAPDAMQILGSLTRGDQLDRRVGPSPERRCAAR